MWGQPPSAIRRAQRAKVTNLVVLCQPDRGVIMTSELVVERDVERVFHLRCSCGTALVTTSNSLTCTSCGQTLAVRRLRKRGQSPVAVEYRFSCCFCGAAILAAGKIATCASCGRTQRILRVEKPSRHQTASRGQYDPKPFLQAWIFGTAVLFLLLLYLFDVTSC